MPSQIAILNYLISLCMILQKRSSLRDRRQSIEYRTRLSYTNAVKTFSTLKDKPLKDITMTDIMDGYNRLSRLKVSTRNLHLGRLSTIFKYAVRPYQIISDNPVNNITPERDKSVKRIKAFTKAEMLQLLIFCLMIL